MGVVEAFTERHTDHDKIRTIRYPDHPALDGFDLGSPYTIRYIANRIMSHSRVSSAQDLDLPDAISPDLKVTPIGVTWEELPESARQRALALAKAKLNLDYEPTMVDPKWRK